MPSASDLLTVAIEVAHRAGTLLRHHAGRPLRAESKSSPTDAVTEVDRASESLILASLREARPGDGVMGEEGAAVEGSTGIRWVVDPLDGTVNYLYGHPSGWGVSLAAEDRAGVLAGVVYDPARDETFAATRGGGALRNGEEMRVSSCTDLTKALVGTGFSYQAERRRHQAGVLLGVAHRVRDIRRIGSAALDLCWVACGRLDAFYEEMLSPWDWAAGSLIVTEAGGRFQRDDDGLVMAAPPGIFADLRSAIGR